MFNNKTILVTGGTGSFGSYFTYYILKKFNPKKIIIFSRDEQKQLLMRNNDNFKKYQSKLRFFIGDIRDEERLTDAMRDVDIVIHAAALKIIDTAEYNPMEFIKTNILGSKNVIISSIKNNVKKVLALSTDKATSPINLYGATKLCSEKLFISSNNYKGKNKIKFSVARYGNVMGSRGSVMPFFIKSQKTGFFTITDKRMTRFNMTLDECVLFVIDCLKRMVGGEIFVPKLPSYKIMDVAKSINPKIKLKFIGKRPGEKIHEEMISKSDSFFSYEYKKFFTIISDSLVNNDLQNKLKKDLKRKICKKCKEDFSYSSDKNDNFLSVNNLKILMKKNATNIF